MKGLSGLSFGTTHHSLLTVFPEGGLCNRMRVVLSAIGIAARSDCHVRVAWRNNAECACRFEDVFLPLNKTRTPVPENFSLVPAHFYDIPGSRNNLWLPALLRKPFYRIQCDGFGASGNEDMALLIEDKGRVYISTCYEFAESSIKANELFRPSPGVLDIVESITGQFDEHTIGMHIRMGDNAMSRRYSPPELFMERANMEISRHSRTKIFLATDSVMVKKDFVARFPNKVITLNGETNRSTAVGMLNAAADLFILAHTTKIYGSFYSSFSATAAEIGNIPIIVLQDKQSERIAQDVK